MTEKNPNKPKKFRHNDPDTQHVDFFKAIHKFVGGFVTQRTELTKQKQERTLINEFIVRLKGLFKLSDSKVKAKEDGKLAGRIRELNKNADDVLKVLSVVREDLRNEVDDELFSFVESVMNPMIRDVERVQKIVKNDGTAYQQIDAFTKYNEWIDKAKLWVQVCSTAKDKEAISKAVVKHTIDDFVAMIDRDLQLIEDYQEHLLDDVEVSEAEKKRLKVEIQKGLNQSIKRLITLKNHPKALSLDNLSQWKDNVDRRRDRYFNAILQLIDGKINEISPTKRSFEEEHGALIGTLEQISYLEMEIPMLAEKFTKDPIDPFEIEVSKQQLLALEDEIHDLYLDMRMPPAIIERLQDLKELLAEVFSNINKKDF